jgi:hypothetical protein
MTNYDLMLIHQRGWGDGAGGRVMRTDATGIGHPDKTAVDAYNSGYGIGRAARANANQTAAKKFKVTTHQITTGMLR